MWGTLAFAVALCLMGNAGVSGDGAMGRLHWCNTLCMCRGSSQVEVKCFSRSDIYELLDFKQIQVIKLERINWQLENQVLWCNDTCLCHQNNKPKVFKCIEENALTQFISDQIGDEYFYQDEGTAERSAQEEEEEEEEARQLEQRKRSEERRKNRKNRKPRKRVKNKHQLPQVVTEPTTTTQPPPPTLEVVEVVTTPQAEVVFVTTPEDRGMWHPPSPTPLILTSGAPTLMSTASSAVTNVLSVTEQTPYEAPQDTMEPEAEEEEEEEEEEDEILEEEEEVLEEEEEVLEEEEEEEEEEPQQQQYQQQPQIDYDDEDDEEAELLPKQEAVAASPAVTAMQPPTRRQPFPPTASSHAANREAETLAPKVSAVLEVPVQRKTVASEVSQDLDELGSTVRQIKSDVVLNQRILLVTVAIAGIAMLGVLMLAVHSCLVSKRQAAAEERRLKESPKEDNHVTKVNLEEAW